MPAKANIIKWYKYWMKFRPSLTHQVYYECVAEKIAERVKSHISERRTPLLLDVGCGQGQLSVLLAEKTGFDVVAMDIIEAPLYDCKKLVRENGLEGKVNLVRASVYQLPFRDDSFDIAISTGYASAATYPGGPEEVSRVVQTDGQLFLDFIRLPNLYQPIYSIKNYLKYKRALKEQKKVEVNEPPRYGKLGLKERFENKLDLQIDEVWNVNTSPPLGGKRLRLLFESTLGKLTSPLLARTILVGLKNKKG